jgi:hypothetical protein
MGYPNTRLISGGTTYYLGGGAVTQVPYSGSGTPWTAQATTPFELSLNEDTGNIWTPAPAPTVPALSGGPPFRPGRSLITKSYDTVTESVGIQLKATSHDNAVALLRLLRQVLNTAQFDSPCILAVQPDGATNTAYFEILYADVAESPSYVSETASGAVLFRVTITWTRTIGFAGSLTTLINGVTIQNRSSGSPDDVESLGTPVGDLIYEGQPLNLLLNPSGTLNRMYLATVYERINTSVTSTKTTTTTTNFSTAAVTVTNARNRAGLKLRILARFDTFTAPSKIQLRVSILDATGGYTIKNLSTLSLPHSSAVSTLLDFGFVDVSSLRSTQSATLAILVSTTLISTDGTSVTAKLDYVETLLYYTFATIPDANIGGSDALYIEQTNDYNVNSVVVPNARPRVYRVSPTNWKGSIAYRGQLPRALSGASLWLGWLTTTSGINDSHVTTDTVTTTATHLPMFHTLRGNS